MLLVGVVFAVVVVVVIVIVVVAVVVLPLFFPFNSLFMESFLLASIQGKSFRMHRNIFICHRI